jgi:hypothetical protein
MKAKNVILVVFATLFSIGTALYAEPESAEGRAYLGVSLDMRPLPELLTKHLGLSPGQGIRINNIRTDSAADKAGLERDDIIVGFEGKPVEDNEQFVEAVRETGAGKEVTLEIIHLGKRKNIKLKLGQVEGEIGQDDWKFPPEPEMMQLWQPGKIFRLKPGGEDWMEIQLNKMPDMETSMKEFFKELYSFQHSGDGEKYEINIEGNPKDEDTLITLRITEPDGKSTEYKTTVKEIDKLPEKYRQPVKDAIEEALKKSRERKFFSNEGPPIPQPPDPEVWRRHFEALQPHPFEPGNMMPGRMEEQLREMRQRLEQLERHLGEMSNYPPKEPNEQKSAVPEMPIQEEKEKVSI